MHPSLSLFTFFFFSKDTLGKKSADDFVVTSEVKV